MNSQALYCNLQRKEIHHISSLLVDTLAATGFKLNIVERYIRSLSNYNDVTTKSTREHMKVDGFRTVLVRYGIVKKDSCGTLHVNEVIEGLWKLDQVFQRR